jgi:hypothetical protein
MSKSEKVVITLRAAVARYNRHLAKIDEKLIKFRTPVDSIFDYAVVSTRDNVVLHMGDICNLENWMREDSVLKAYEVIG